MTSILLADDHAIVRRGMKEVLQEELPGVRIVEAENAGATIDAAREGEFDLVILDVSLPGRSGLDVLKDIKAAHPKLPVLMLSMHPEEQFAVRALRAGAAGYVTKHSPPEELLSAVRKALAGGKYVSAALAERLATEVSGDTKKEPHELLSDREFQVLMLIASGHSLTEIGATLSVSVQTVSTYRTRLLEKMALTSNAELTQYVRLHNL